MIFLAVKIRPSTYYPWVARNIDGSKLAMALCMFISVVCALFVNLVAMDNGALGAHSFC